MKTAAITTFVVFIVGLGPATSYGGQDLCAPLSKAVISGPLSTDADSELKEESPDAPDPTFEEQIVELVNQERWAAGGRPPLKHNAQLETAAEGHSEAMAVRDFFMHCDPDTSSSHANRIAATGYAANYSAENIAAGYSTPSAVMAAWMASGGHETNILSTNSREIGVGYYYQSGDQGNVRENPPTGGCPATSSNNGPYLRYWTQNFGRSNSIYPVVINREAHLTESRDVDLFLYGSFNEMRLRNENGTWSAWMPFAANTAWQLSSGNGTKTVNAEMRSTSPVYASSDTIILENTSEEIFFDDFESGDTSDWSDTQP